MERRASIQDDRDARAASEAPHVGRTEAIGQSEIFLEFQERLSRIARVNRPALLVGERGSGKELAVSRLHYLSPRWQGPLLALNCAALSPSLIESELFGHEPGAFTGAVGRRAGRFEAADGGTLFLDEIGQLPLEVQEKLLRVVEYASFERVGGSQPIQADVRIIGATNADLAELARQGRFKTDLLDRLSFEVVFVPPCASAGRTLCCWPGTLPAAWPLNSAGMTFPGSARRRLPRSKPTPGRAISVNSKMSWNGRWLGLMTAR